MRYGMLVDLDRCTGCEACVVACGAHNGVPPGSWFSWVQTLEVGRFPDTRRAHLVVTCNQCADPPCVRGCPVGATFVRDDGIVSIDPHRCIACKYCFWTCPYGVRVYDPARDIVRKCEFCHHRLSDGRAPACVEACPTDAILVGDLDDPGSDISKALAARETEVVAPELGTSPAVRYAGLDRAWQALGLEGARHGR